MWDEAEAAAVVSSRLRDRVGVKRLRQEDPTERGTEEATIK
jgi:hypothetical protein